MDEDTLYARIITGELTNEEIEELKQSGDWAKIQAILDKTNTYKLSPLDKKTGLTKLVREREAKEAKFQKKGENRSLIKYIQGIAAVAAVFFLAYFFLMPDDTTILKSEYANNRSHQFEDGSSVELNAGSQLSFNKNQWSKKRQVKLDGEAYFKVEPGAAFTVTTPTGTVSVLGTQFNVRSREGSLQVECFEGKVRVERFTNQDTLNAGKAVYIDDSNTRVAYDINSDFPEWTRGIIKFQRGKISDVLKELERQYDIKVEATDLNAEFTGVFNTKDLREAIDQIAKPLGLKTSISDNGKTVRFYK